MSILINNADIFTLQITTYNKWLILKVNKTPKLRYIGNGSILSDFNSNDIQISKEALEILNKNLLLNIDQKNPAFEILTKNRIWWPSQSGIIIPPNELIHVFAIPYHTICENVVDEELKKMINNQ